MLFYFWVPNRNPKQSHNTTHDTNMIGDALQHAQCECYGIVAAHENRTRYWSIPYKYPLKIERVFYAQSNQQTIFCRST